MQFSQELNFSPFSAPTEQMHSKPDFEETLKMCGKGLKVGCNLKLALLRLGFRRKLALVKMHLIKPCYPPCPFLG